MPDRLRRALAAASAAAALWALAINLSGGIILDVGGVAITSRNPRNPLIAAIVLALIALALPMPNRREVMAASGDAKAEAEVLSASVTTIMVIFRAVVRLHGEHADRDHEETCRHVARLAGIDPEPFLRALRHARGSAPLTGAAVGETLAGYLAGMEALVAHIDRLAHAG